MFQTKLANKKSYKTSIGAMRLRLPDLQKVDEEIQRIKATEELQDIYKEVDRVL